MSQDFNMLGKNLCTFHTWRCQMLNSIIGSTHSTITVRNINTSKFETEKPDLPKWPDQGSQAHNRDPGAAQHDRDAEHGRHRELETGEIRSARAGSESE